MNMIRHYVAAFLNVAYIAGFAALGILYSKAGGFLCSTVAVVSFVFVAVYVINLIAEVSLIFKGAKRK